MKSSNASSSGRSSRPRSWSIFAARISVQICCRMAGSLRRVERGDGGVLVEQLLQACDVAVAFRRAPSAGSRWSIERGVRAALGLGALARVVDQERVDQRQVAERGVGAARRRHAAASCRAATPGCRACRGARPRPRRKPRADPVVGGQIVVARRQVGVVVDRDRVLAEAPRRLDHQHDVAGLQRGDARSRRRVSTRSTNSSPGGGPQCCDDRVA